MKRKSGKCSEKAAGYSQPPGDFILCTTQLGFRPDSIKPLTLIVPEKQQSKLPDKIPFFIQCICDRRMRDARKPPAWSDKTYRWPFELLAGKYTPDERNYRSLNEHYQYKGWIRRLESRWGTFWQGDFTDFQKEGVYQIETEYQFTMPFSIEKRPYDRLMRGFLIYLYCQRSGFDVPGIRPAMHLDDAVLDTDGTQIPAAGGWYDAGDNRKWMALTQSNLEGLYHVLETGPAAFRQQVIDEMNWGNLFFHNMINEQGRVYEDVGGGDIKIQADYDKVWWCENHPGCIANNSGNRYTDNIPGSGDERKVRTACNPWCQFEFIKNQALISTVLPGAYGSHCRVLAERAWRYSQQKGHDQRTIFVAAELRAAMELLNTGSRVVSLERIAELVEAVLARQDQGREGLNHYFLEKDGRDGYRSIGFSCEPPLALLRLCELKIKGLEKQTPKAEKAMLMHVENYLLKDAKSNPFGVTPYGVYINPHNLNAQVFRNAGRGRFVRTFIAPFNEQEMVHGGNGSMMQQAHLIARAGRCFGRRNWQDAAERLLQWAMGHNTVGLSLFTGIGFRHPVAFSARNVKIPEACVVGFLGRPDDSPYLETSSAVEWSTQEIWDVPHFHAVCAAAFLD
jgi:hypothetical protein